LKYISLMVIESIKNFYLLSKFIFKKKRSKNQHNLIIWLFLNLINLIIKIYLIIFLNLIKYKNIYFEIIFEI